MSKITAPNQQTHANKNKRFRLRCIVCCQICDKQMKENGEITKHNRLGYQTQWQCNQCGKDANSFISRRKGTQSQRDLSPALCAEKFKRFERIFSDEHRSCMQIHQSASPYPGLICRPQPEEGTPVPSFGLISPPKQLTSQGDEEMLTVAQKRRKRKRHDQGPVQALFLPDDDKLTSEAKSSDDETNKNEINSTRPVARQRRNAATHGRSTSTPNENESRDKNRRSKRSKGKKRKR
eukprot:CAMPEP_0204846578 /NCGR_PEP_ID=MMETSP1347-20130617/2100_1 /ASSEMBLY_ACC=CAM_ASM_000690 /TAXON_ID=215587 /ORGANISM="Aplanochytrium stocchinoi, Strain GSBS06" /LENGTH=235 /DNA_ID=CAMNT_0051987205 /DNA_START=393 /DNA_END=1100 /DNA_ORIENTATION=+